MSASEQSLITIGITCFNAEKTIERAIRSAQQQDWASLEIIIVDDCSTDRSVAIAENIAAEDPRIRLVKQPENKGYPAALNRIIKEAKGEFIAIFDDDDVSTPSRLEKQYRRLTNYEKQKGADIVFCYSNRYILKKEGATPDQAAKAIGYTEPEPHGTIVADFILWHLSPKPYVWGQFGSCTLLFRKSIISETGWFDENFRRSAEWDMAIRASMIDAHFIAVNDALVTQYKTQTADKAGKTPLVYAKKLRHKHKAYLKNHHAYWASLALAYARYYYTRNKIWRFRFYVLLSCMLAPHLVLPDVLIKRFGK